MKQPPILARRRDKERHKQLSWPLQASDPLTPTFCMYWGRGGLLGTVLESDTPRKAGSLISGAASKAVARNVRLASMPEAVRTPKGLKLSSRGQGHAFCGPRPRIASLPISPTLKRASICAKDSAPAALNLPAIRGRIVRPRSNGCRGGSRTAPTSPYSHP